MENNINRLFKFSELVPSSEVGGEDWVYSGMPKITKYLGTSDTNDISYFSSDCVDDDADSVVENLQSQFVKSKAVKHRGVTFEFGTLLGYKAVVTYSESTDIYLVK